MNSLSVISLVAQDLREYLLENDPGDYDAEMKKFWRIVRSAE